MTVEDFIARWRMRCAGVGSERPNAQMCLCDLCEVLGVAAPHPSGARADDDYVFEYQLRGNQPWGDSINRRIDLYKRGRFVLEAKQSREPGQAKAIPPSPTAEHDPWDVPMRNAVQQALRYVQMLPASHPAPPFIIACDVGAVIELYADFSGSGPPICRPPCTATATSRACQTAAMRRTASLIVFDGAGSRFRQKRESGSGVPAPLYSDRTI